MNVLSTATNYFIFFGITILVYLVAPFIYETTVIPIAKSQSNKASILKGLDIIFRVVWILLPFYLVIIGISTKQNLVTTIGFFMFLFIIIGIFVIDLKKGQDIVRYSLGENIESNSLDKKNELVNIGETFNILIEVLTKNLKGIFGLWIGIIIISMIILVILASQKIYYPKGSLKKNYSFFGIIWGAIFIFSLPIIVLFLSQFQSNK